MNLKNDIRIISIITPSYKQGSFIEETIQSVLSQKGDFYIDYIIMDGGSNDQSLDVIKKYENLLKEKCGEKLVNNILFYVSKDKNFYFNRCKGISYRWSSEKDNGQADAINKGIEKSIGGIIGWINSDDVYYDGVFDIIIKQDFKKNDFYYGNGMWISKIGKNLLPYPTFKPSFYSFFYQCTLCQPAVFFSKKVFLEIGLLDNNYYCGFDFEYWMRALFFNKSFFYINSYFAKSRMYKENKSLANQDILYNDVLAFKEKYYKKLKLDENKIKEFKYINIKTIERVKILNYKLETGDKINLLFDATVILNDLHKNSGRSGIFFVSFNVLKSLLNREDINVYLYCDKNQKFNLQSIINNRFSNNNLKIITKKDLIDNCEILDIDAYLSPIFKIPLEIRKHNNIVKYTILYDLIALMFPEYFPIKQGWFFEMIEGINKDDHYFAISEQTKKDFVKNIMKIDPDKIKVTPLAVSDNFYCNKNEEEKIRIFKKYNIPNNKKYIFSLCTLEPRKNLIMVVKCFIKFIELNNIKNLVFLLGGGHWDEFILILEKEVKNFKEHKDKIIKVGYIDDEDLSIFYSFSEFFVYLSLYEGFGLPVLEAMKCEIPVITSNNSSLPEVIGDAGITINPRSEQELINAFSELYFNNDLKMKLSEKGSKRALLFSWDKTVNIMVDDIVQSVKNNIYNFNKDNKFKKPLYKFKIKIYIFYNKWFDLIKFFILSPKVFFKKIFLKLKLINISEFCFSIYRKLPIPVKKVYRLFKYRIINKIKTDI